MSDARSLRILFAEDEDSLRSELTKSLTDGGFVVEAVTSGKDAIAALGDQKFDVVVLDYEMSNRSGSNILRWMLEQKDEPPAIVLTGAKSEGSVVEAMNLGAYDHISKDNNGLGSMPVIIKGVHERHLFRRQNEELIRDLRGRNNIHGSIKVFERAMNSLSKVINNSLSLILLNLQEFIRDHVVPYQPEENEPRSQAAFDEIKKELNVVSSSMRSMFDLVTAMQGKISGGGERARTDQASEEEDQSHSKERENRIYQ